MPNALAEERSPYLRQHADDPVDWYPWGSQAFERAKATGRPVFLSVGYASCHWCHVMHRESFSDPDVAALLNASFVSVKVDRETRPDVDEHYMAYVVAATGHGGWPMSVFLTPDLVPVFGGTYYPPESHHGIPSFRDVVESIDSAFRNRAEDVGEAAQEALEHVSAMFAPLPYREPVADIAQVAFHTLQAERDRRHGGLVGAPKFPQAPVVDFLLAYHRATADSDALEAAEETLRGIVRGGVYDQAGGGIARYAVDDAWLVPHFEKMLYDNAQLLSTLAALHAASPSAEWAHAMRQTAAFLERDLGVDGFFASSLDADTLGTEGATYVWSYDELAEVLTPDELALAEALLGVTREGNWEGVNILTRREGRVEDAVAVDAVLAKLLSARQGRPQPARDDKVIVAWNALAALGLIDAGNALNDSALADRGFALVQRLADEAIAEDGGVRRVLRDPSSEHVRVLEDAVALSLALLCAADVGDPTFADQAQRVFDVARERFYDGDGTWYVTPTDTELPLRPRDQRDSPTPSGASLAARVSLRLAETTLPGTGLEIADRTLGRMVPIAESAPAAAGSALRAMLKLSALVKR